MLSGPWKPPGYFLGLDGRSVCDLPESVAKSCAWPQDRNFREPHFARFTKQAQRDPSGLDELT